MNRLLKVKEILDLWDLILKDKNELYICTLTTKNISNNFSFLFRNRIIKYLAPPKVKIINLDFDLRDCEEAVEKTKYENSKHTIHSYMISESIKLLEKNSFCLLIDIDAFPLNEFAIKTAFSLAKLKGINGNIQRTNCIENNKNIFIAESFMCFNVDLVKSLGDKAWQVNERSDVSEEISWIYPELIDQHLFKPIKTLFKPIWNLREEFPEYGIGTTFGYGNQKINYHHFYARNFLSRLHFFFISLNYYLKIILRDKKKRNLDFRKFISSIKNEIKFSLKYVFGNLD